ncbi:MAG: HAMP domain-containing histidine kinase [Magnetococcales bacterium]|nr:HAMP domain-containing histidine kinase [Magnetococcales bacterium]
MGNSSSTTLRRLAALWQATSLTSKAATITILLSGLFLSIVDYWQTIQINSIFRNRLLNELETQAQRDRLLFDQYFRAQEQAVQLFAQHTTLHHYVDQAQNQWQEAAETVHYWDAMNPPPWLPSRSLLRNLVAAPYILLLDKAQQVREIYSEHHDTTPIPHDVLQKITDSPLETESNVVFSGSDGTIYLMSIGSVINNQNEVYATGVWLAPLDNHFLSIFHTTTESNNIVVLINAITNQVFATSRPDRVTTGQAVAQLETENILFGKLLDYGSSILLPIRFISMVPLADVDKISHTVLQTIRHQFILGYGMLAMALLTIVIVIIHKVQSVTERMIDTTAGQLGLQKQHAARGDQLQMIDRQLQWMTKEIIESRQREQLRQQELQQMNDSLRASLQTIRKAQDRLVESEKMASLGSLVAGVAHEINTPVGTGITAASFLDNKCQEYAARLPHDPPGIAEWQQLFEDLRESSQMVLSNLMRAAELVRSFKQIAVDRSQEERRLFALQDYLHHVLRSLHPLLGRSRHRIILHCPGEILLDSYPGALSQIMTHLVVNSLMHAFPDGEAGTITIEIIQREKATYLYYSDNGCGMSEEERQRIFEPFFTTTRHRGSIGLGLHVVFNLVSHSLLGSIHCDSAPGQGTRYEITIPQPQAYG